MTTKSEQRLEKILRRDSYVGLHAEAHVAYDAIHGILKRYDVENLLSKHHQHKLLEAMGIMQVVRDSASNSSEILMTEICK